MLRIFISGLEKQSGKTIIAAGLAGTMQSLNYSTSVFKPIQTGAKSLNGFMQSQDLAIIKRIDSNINTGFSYAFTGTMSPLVSAYEANGVKIKLDRIYNDFMANTQMSECHIVEGANGISSPIAENLTEIDLVKSLGLPLILVINPKTSSVGNVIAAINFIRVNKANFLGVIVNNYNKDSENL
ncbi:dethiobiotin synthase, partial [bacterium]|nr:dethiobiotin synthase [bacterium]